MGKRCRTTRLERRSIDSASHEFRIDYEQTKHIDTVEAIHSDAFSAGGYMWRLDCYPYGDGECDDDDYLSVFFELLTEFTSVNAIFEIFLMDKDGHPCLQDTHWSCFHLFNRDKNAGTGWSQFISRSDLEEEGHITLICAIMVIRDIPSPVLGSIPVPDSDIGKHLGALLDSTDGADVSFTIDSETFHAHRAVLAARSPVFKAELLGSMAEATMSSITLHDITPATFRVMLQFMYTDALPELGDSPTETLQHLLAAADRYALDRLKVLCAQKLWDNVSVDTVATILACAEMYSCLELKNKCLDFFAAEKNFKKAVLTEGFVKLVQQFPSIIVELREKAGT
ncbi:hypothetical protein SEVIR_6G223200v4 [Setaria viridis]|uniref:BTB domain-containing protein n=2 Tax=Setaria viridis TaxID=4556 RepID=A0A4U6UBD1_SETVI|nr:BTB/POZ and MATH domain-containing protein 1-like [Setaria viridis]TKW11283.1 hypothetical protein SEVIR_6G223200v2 [Setaria viridis]